MTGSEILTAQDRRFRRMSRLAGMLPRWMARIFSWFRTRYVLATGDFAKTRVTLAANIAPALPPGVDPKWVAERTLRNYGMFLTDYFRIPAMTKKSTVAMFGSVQGNEHVDAALKAGRGAILVTPHLGNWEMGGYHLRFQGYPVTVVGVADPVNPAVSRFRDESRRRHGIEVVNVSDSAMTPIVLARALAENRIVAMLGDRNFFETDPVDVELFGRPAKFPRGPALLALAAESPLIPAFVTMGHCGQYDALLAPPIAVPESGDRRAKSDAMIRELARVFEAKIREYPDQWYVFDPYWGGEPVSTIARAAAGMGGENVSPLR